jgi:hypothetical protein
MRRRRGQIVWSRRHEYAAVQAGCWNEPLTVPSSISRQFTINPFGHHDITDLDAAGAEDVAPDAQGDVVLAA